MQRANAIELNKDPERMKAICLALIHFSYKKMIDLLKCGLKSVLNLISTIQIIYWKLAAIIAKRWRWGVGGGGVTMKIQ